MTHANQHNVKSSRIENRCTREQKDKLQLAAELLGVSMSNFTLAASLEKAQEVISKQSILELSLADKKAFVNAITNPEAPNKALMEAKRRFTKEVK